MPLRLSSPVATLLLTAGLWLHGGISALASSEGDSWGALHYPQRVSGNNLRPQAQVVPRRVERASAPWHRLLEPPTRRTAVWRYRRGGGYPPPSGRVEGSHVGQMPARPAVAAPSAVEPSVGNAYRGYRMDGEWQSRRRPWQGGTAYSSYSGQSLARSRQDLDLFAPVPDKPPSGMPEMNGAIK